MIHYCTQCATRIHEPKAEGNGLSLLVKHLCSACAPPLARENRPSTGPLDPGLRRRRRSLRR